MVRKLKFHEEKLLRKVDFINWDIDNNIHEVKILKRFFIQKREDYTKYIIEYLNKWNIARNLCFNIK